METKIVQKNIDCPVCKVKINWKPSNVPNKFSGRCPKCGMGFIDNKGMIMSVPEFSKK